MNVKSISSVSLSAISPNDESFQRSRNSKEGKDQNSKEETTIKKESKETESLEAACVDAAEVPLESTRWLKLVKGLKPQAKKSGTFRTFLKEGRRGLNKTI